jgi:hypothetical protein
LTLRCGRAAGQAASTGADYFFLFIIMAHAKKTAPAPMGMAKAREIVAFVSARHGITTAEAARLTRRFLRRERERRSAKGWWLRLLDAQFQTHIGPHGRIRCGRETGLSHLTPEPGGCCHDCGCIRGEYHVFGCDSEECSNCHEQAFCCDCDDGSSAET